VPDHGSPTVRRRRLAAELRRLRERSGLTGDEVAARIGWSPSKVSRYELARTGLKPAEVLRLLDLYGVHGPHQAQLLALAQEATQRGWWEDYADVLPAEYADLIGLEAEARSSATWQIDLIPDLLQTEAYAREVSYRFRQRLSPLPPSQIERQVQARMLRQQVLYQDPPLELSVVLDESVLRRQLAEPAVMRAQLERLGELAQRPNVTLRVLPLAGPYPIVTGSFVLLRFGTAHEAQVPMHPDVVYTAHLVSNLFFEGELDTYQYQHAFELLAEESLRPTDSVDLIASIAKQVWK